MFSSYLMDILQNLLIKLVFFFCIVVIVYYFIDQLGTLSNASYLKQFFSIGLFFFDYFFVNVSVFYSFDDNLQLFDDDSIVDFLELVLLLQLLVIFVESHRINRLSLSLIIISMCETKILGIIYQQVSPYLQSPRIIIIDDTCFKVFTSDSFVVRERHVDRHHLHGFRWEWLSFRIQITSFGPLSSLRPCANYR